MVFLGVGLRKGSRDRGKDLVSRLWNLFYVEVGFGDVYWRSFSDDGFVLGFFVFYKLGSVVL